MKVHLVVYKKGSQTTVLGIYHDYERACKECQQARESHGKLQHREVIFVTSMRINTPQKKLL